MTAARWQRGARAISGFASGTSKLARPPRQLLRPAVRPFSGPVLADPLTIVQTMDDAVDTSGSTLTIPFPSACTAGNLMVLFVAVTRNTLAQVPTPAGWSLVGDFDDPPSATPLVGRMFWKVSAGGETSQTITCTVNLSSGLTGQFVEVSGATSWFVDEVAYGARVPAGTPLPAGEETDCGTTGTLAQPVEFAFAASAHLQNRAIGNVDNYANAGFTVIDMVIPGHPHVRRPKATCAYGTPTSTAALNPIIHHQTNSTESKGMVATFYGTV